MPTLPWFQKNKMRCFIALDLPEDIKKEFAKAQKQIPSENAKILNVNPDIFHLTLRFLGDVDDSQAEKIKNAMKNLKFAKFKAKLSGIGVFPRENFIRVVWVGLEPKEKFLELHNAVDKALEKAGIMKEERFESHATLCRVKYIKDKDRFMEKIKKIKVPELEFEAVSVKLKKSILTPEGPIYSDIAEFLLN